MPASDLGVSRSYTSIALSLVLATAGVAAAQGQATDCRDAQECRELALGARARGAYEVFHDLAWRAVQTGQPNDPDLMYLLARAQALSGRRRDAVVMLRRLAESGFVIDATDEDFRRVRELADWQYVAALANRPPPAAAAPAPAPAVLPAKPIRSATRAAVPRLRPPSPLLVAPAPPSARAATPAASPPPAAPPTATPAPRTAAAPPAASPARAAAAPPAPAARRTLPLEAAAVEDAARFSTGAFTPGGLAYDAISRRFLFGDVTGQRLFVVGEGSDRSVDLVRADSAGFDDVTAIAIDSKRGDLWVASTAANGSAGAVHRLQLISGRALTKFVVPALGPIRLSDLAVAGDGSLFVLDSAAPRVLVLRPGASAVEPLMRLTTKDPVSLAIDDSGQRAYVAHREGIARLDLQARRSSPLTVGTGIALTDFDYIKLYRDSLIGSQLQPDGSRGIVRLQLNRDRRAVARATLIEESSTGDDAATAATIFGDALYYLVAPRGQDSKVGSLGVRVRRIKLPPSGSGGRSRTDP